jgi:hypothetical protein
MLQEVRRSNTLVNPYAYQFRAHDNGHSTVHPDFLPPYAINRVASRSRSTKHTSPFYNASGLCLSGDVKNVS